MSARVLTHAPWTAVPGLTHGFLPGRAEPPAPTLVPRQVHGIAVVTADPTTPEPPEADGLVTDAGGTRVGIVTADCVPILLLARQRHAVAAVHAGWRGAAAGVTEAALAHLRAAFGVEPADVEAVMGPAIGGCCYEVGPEVRAAFARRTGEITAPAWGRREGRDMLDLRVALGCLLATAGVGRVATLGPCTRCSAEYCSYRREGAAVGRQTSFIGWA